MFTSILSLAKLFFGKISITQWIVVALLVVIGVQYLQNGHLDSVIKDKEADIVKLGLKVETLQHDLAVQTESIRQAGMEKENLQKSLDGLVKKLGDSNSNYSSIVKKLGSTPIPKDCKSSVVELRDINSKLSKEWNKQ